MKNEILIPKRLHEIKARLLSFPLRKKDSKGLQNWDGYGEMYTWERNDGVQFGIPREVKEELNIELPSISVIADKIICILIKLIQEQQFSRETKLPETIFAFKGIALKLGYTDAEITRGGSFFKNIKMALLALDKTYYRIPDKKLGIKTYEPFYTLESSPSKKGIWRVKFNDWIAKDIIEILNGKAEQFFIHFLKEVADKHTTNHPILHRFYNYLISLRTKSGYTLPTKITTLLKEISVSPQYQNRPGKLFKLLTNSIEYISQHFPGDLVAVRFHKSFDEKHDFRELKTLRGLSSWSLNDFKLMLPDKTVNFKDCLISFYIPPRQNTGSNNYRKKAIDKSSDEYKLIGEVLNWIYESWCPNISHIRLEYSKTEIASILHKAIKTIGLDTTRDIFNRESNEAVPNANRLMKTLEGV